MSSAESRRQGRNATTDKTLQILGLFSNERLSISAADLVRDLEMSRSAAYRYIQSLVREQFLESAPDGELRLGMRILDLARIARAGYGLSELAVPVMRSLAARHRQTVLLTALVGTSVVCLEREEWHGQFVRLSYEPGLELPVNAGASALILLAWMPREDVRRLLNRPLRRMTTNTLVDVDSILHRLDQIRADGHAVTLAEVDQDAMGLAAPIMTDGRVVAGLSIAALQSRMTEPQRHKALADLRDSAASISRRLQLAHG